MIKKIKKLLGMCDRHIFETVDVKQSVICDELGSVRPIGYTYYKKCVKCGKTRSVLK